MRTPDRSSRGRRDGAPCSRLRGVLRTARPEPAVGTRPPVLRAAWLSLLACTCATAVLQFDGTMVTAAIPALSRELAVDASAASWVLIAYFAPFALLLLPGGRLTDRLGARRVALAGLLVYAAGALAGALAPDFAVLVASRALQGMAAGLISPAALVGAVSGFPADRRGGAIGIWGAASAALSLVGPLVGGLLTATLGWRSNWWALVAIAAAVGLAVARYAPDRPVSTEAWAGPDRG